MTAPVTPSVADTLIQLADHIDGFADAIPALVEQGRYWFFRPSTNTFHGSDLRGGEPGDFYLYDASPAVLEQWDGDWDALASDLINALDAALKRPLGEA